MFNSGIKRNYRCNGINSSPNIDQVIKDKSVCHTNYKVISSHGHKDVYNNEKRDKGFIKSESFNSIHNSFDAKIKIENDEDLEDKITAHSIIGLSEEIAKLHKSPTEVKPRIKRGSIRATHHETLQRIETDQDVYNHYQQHWFSASLEKFKLEDRSREERIEITRHEFRRHIQQIMRSNIGQPNKFPLRVECKERKCIVEQQPSPRNKYQTGYSRLVAPKMCQVENCRSPALPCAKHCTLHIMLNSDQVLFDYCTAKFADNTQCSVPVFDITHELPLCPEHARKRDNYKLYQEAKPKKLRKKVKPSAMIRPQKRNKKKRRPLRPSDISPSSAIVNDSPVCEEIEVNEINEINEITEISELELEKDESPEMIEEELQIVDQVLGLNESDGLEHALAQQAHLLEETDISTVLSTIQVDEFSDFFAVNRNGEYEPSREEAEELEKALAAVDNDVKSLEKLSQSQGILDSLMDEHVLTESLIQIPEMFHNGYAPCGDNMTQKKPVERNLTMVRVKPPF